jgi:hypothetical protein
LTFETSAPRTPRDPFALLSGELQPEDALGILVIHLAEDRFGQAKTVDSPPTLRRDTRRRVVEVLILGFEEAVIDPVLS